MTNSLTERAIRLVKGQSLLDFAAKLDEAPHNDGPTYTTADLITMLRNEAAKLEQPDVRKPLDPFPWLGRGFVRNSVRGLTAWDRTFDPRDGYEQDQSKYLS